MNEYGQFDIFDYISEPVTIKKPIRLIELFAGYGSQAMALKRIGAKFEHYRVVEIDKYAIASYNAVILPGLMQIMPLLKKSVKYQAMVPNAVQLFPITAYRLIL